MEKEKIFMSKNIEIEEMRKRDPEIRFILQILMMM